MNRFLLTLMLLLPTLAAPSANSSDESPPPKLPASSSTATSALPSKSKSSSRSSTPAAQAESLKLKKDHFSALLQSIPYPEFRDLICSGHYIDETDWIYQFLEIEFLEKIFQRNTDGSLNLDAFDDAFYQKNQPLKNPRNWAAEQLAEYSNEFHTACYEMFIQRAIHEIIQNKMSWTDAVSIPNSHENLNTLVPHNHLYPIYYLTEKRNDKKNHPPLDIIHIVLVEILVKVFKAQKNTNFLNWKPKCSINLDVVAIPHELKSYTCTDFPISINIFDQKYTQTISSICSNLEGYTTKCVFPDGSLITDKDQSFYYYTFDSTTKRFELNDYCQCAFDVANLKATHTSTDKKTIYGIHHDKQDQLFAWNFTVKDSAPESTPIVITNLANAKKIDAKLFKMLETETLLQLSNLQASDQFIIGTFKNDNFSQRVLVVLQKSTTKPEEFSLIQTIHPIQYNSSVRLSLHKKTNRLAVIDSENNKLIVYQLSRNELPKIVKTIQYPGFIRDGKESSIGQLIKRIHWSSSGALLTIVTTNPKTPSQNSIQILDTSTWKESHRFYSSEDNPEIEISPNNQYCLYIKNMNPETSEITYIVHDMINKKEIMSLTNDVRVAPLILHWNQNPKKNQLFCFTLPEEETSIDATVLDLNTIIERTISPSIEYTFWQYIFSLEETQTIRVPQPITPMKIRPTTPQAEINAYYQRENARYDQENDLYFKQLIYNDDYAQTAQQCFLLGQLFFENAKTIPFKVKPLKTLAHKATNT